MHPRKLTWNLKIPPSKRRNIYKPPIIGVPWLVFRGCKYKKVSNQSLHHNRSHFSSSFLIITIRNCHGFWKVSRDHRLRHLSRGSQEVLRHSKTRKKNPLVQWSSFFGTKTTSCFGSVHFFGHSQWAVLDRLYHCDPRYNKHGDIFCNETVAISIAHGIKLFWRDVGFRSSVSCLS